MSSLIFLIPVALVLAIVAMGFFLWAVRDGQYDDLDRDGSDLLFDEDQDAVKHEQDKEQNDAR